MSTNFVPIFDRMGTQPGNNHIGGNIGKTDRGNMWNGAVVHAKLVSNAPDEDFQTGRTKAPVVSVEPPQSVNILIDSKNRLNPEIFTNPFDFSVSLNSNLYRSRFMRVTKVVIPKPLNVTKNNNQFIYYEGADVRTEVTIPPGYYNTTSIGNTLQSLCTTASTLGSVFTCVFDQATRTFNLSSTNNFFIESDCTFIQRGSNFIPFDTRSVAAGATVFDDGELQWNSGVSSMLYTRYVYVCSEALNKYCFADSKSSDTGLNEDILAIADITSMYNAQDWAIATPFAGGYETVLTPEAPYISLRNPQRAMSERADVYVLDEYGINFNDSFDLSYVGGPTYPTNQAGVSFWMEVSF
jgi:hypothetical protein